LVDTAGLRQSDDTIEQSGIARTAREMERADLILEVVDASQPAETANRIPLSAHARQRHILILNKADQSIDSSWSTSSAIPVSCLTTDGIDVLRKAIRDLVLRSGPLLGDHPVAINARHQSCFQRVANHLEAASAALRETEAPEFIALDLREALQALGQVVGQIDGEEVLDQIFRQFCIGK
jgi:tRNA modification GTPase